MRKDKDRTVIINKGGGVIYDLTLRIKLILRLMGDRRVNPLLKLLPIGSFFYLIVPDLIPGPIDDAAIVWLGTSLFVELCPSVVVQEHKEALNLEMGGESYDAQDDEEIIDAEYWEEE